MKNLALLIIVFTNYSNLFAQLPALDHKAYDLWKRVEKEQLSRQGKIITYEQTVLRGNTELHLYFKETQQHDSIIRAKDALIAPDESYIAYKVVPDYDSLRKLELNKVDKKKWPKDSLYIHNLTTDSLLSFAKVKTIQQAAEAPVLGFLQEVTPPKPNKSEPKKLDKLCFWKKPITTPVNPFKTDGQRLMLYSSGQKNIPFIDSITQFSLSPDGKYVAVLKHHKVKLDSSQVLILNTTDLTVLKAFEFVPQAEQLTWNKQATQLAYLYSTDTTKVKNYQLALYDLPTQVSGNFGDSLDFEKTMKGEFQQVATGRAPLFSANGAYLFFGVAARQTEQKDTLTESEKVNLDIWHYQDTKLQAQQLLRKNQDLKKSTLYVYHLNTQRLQKVGADSLELRLDENTNGAYILASNPNPYLIEAQWKAPNKADYYRINLETGQAILIGKGLAYTGDLSADGRYFSFYLSTAQKWMLFDIDKQKQTCMNCSRKDIRWEEDLNGQPMEAGPVGFIGYAKDSKAVYFQSEYDIWQFETETLNLSSLSKEQATKEKIELRFTPYQTDSVWTNLADGYFTGLRKANKNELLYFYSDQDGLRLQLEVAQRIAGLQKAEKSNTFLLRKMDVQTYPDLWLHETKLNAGRQISVANPQQKNYNWASVELVSWKAYDGQMLQGLLYKPANYDATQKYPLLLYYYELNSDNLHNYQAPKPSASIINPTEYASGGYLVFVPDIRYEPGKPAKGAYNAIMSATDHLLKNYPIDAKRMGLQGQSWGGYQTAMLITMTDRYAAAMAGAPVGNMFSAYGGIRWGSGLNRQFQYESTQSRIGATIWEKPELYIENSPLFHLPKVQTPLLIMANDQDGAVPWYQGLELYNGMRRLGKPCWMLNYNNDDHNLTKLANKYDLSIRMRQFFDHYLMNQAAPSWMTNGIQAVDKGKVTGY